MACVGSTIIRLHILAAEQKVITEFPQYPIKRL
jgi:hypothetical protein